jgi:hypothetical protein
MTASFSVQHSWLSSYLVPRHINLAVWNNIKSWDLNDGVDSYCSLLDYATGVGGYVSFAAIFPPYFGFRIVGSYQFAWRHITKKRNLNIHFRENLKSHRNSLLWAQCNMQKASPEHMFKGFTRTDLIITSRLIEYNLNGLLDKPIYSWHSTCNHSTTIQKMNIWSKQAAT